MAKATRTVSFRNDGGSFTEIAGSLGLQNTEWGKSFIPVDFDNDGDADLLLTNYAGNQWNRLYRNDGGTYTDITVGSGFDFADYCTGAAWADFDNDGLLDCYITGYEVSHKNRLMHNQGGGVFVDVAPGTGRQRRDRLGVPAGLVRLRRRWRPGPLRGQRRLLRGSAESSLPQ